MRGETKLEELEEELQRIEDELVDTFPSRRADYLIEAWTKKMAEADGVDDEWVGPEVPRSERAG